MGILGQSIRAQEERDQLNKTHRPGADAAVASKPTTTTKKKTKRKNYKNILDTALKLNRKRHSVQTSKQPSRENSLNQTDARMKLDHQRFQQLIADDIARAQERLQNGKTTGRSEQNSVQKMPQLESSQSGRIQVGPTCRIDLLKDEDSYNNDIDLSNNLVYQEEGPNDGQPLPTES